MLKSFLLFFCNFQTSRGGFRPSYVPLFCNGTQSQISFFGCIQFFYMVIPSRYPWLLSCVCKFFVCFFGCLASKAGLGTELELRFELFLIFFDFLFVFCALLLICQIFFVYVHSRVFFCWLRRNGRSQGLISLANFGVGVCYVAWELAGGERLASGVFPGAGECIVCADKLEIHAGSEAS